MRAFHRITLAMASLSMLALGACSKQTEDAHAAQTAHDHGDTSATATVVANDSTIPADAKHVSARLDASPRHGQFVMIPRPGAKDSIRAFIVYPERSTPAPVVIVVHEIFGLSAWVRGVADQLAREGFIAIAPDLLSGQPLPGAPDNVSMQDGMAAVSKLNMDDVMKDIDAVAAYGTALPAASKKIGIVGFCWGGGVSFTYATHNPALAASVVYYGTPPDAKLLPKIKAPVLGLYAGNDARVTSTVAATDSAMKAQSKTYEHYIYEGSGHGFLRQQDGQNGANLTASQKSWPATLAWFRQHLAP